MVRIFFIAIFLFFSLTVVVFGQSQIAGSQDYGLGGSSIMWLPRSSALFLNPSQIARIRQGEMLFSTHRFSALPSLSAAYFVPFTGTFAIGVANDLHFKWYSSGYGRLLGKHLSVGGALTFIDDSSDQFAASLGISGQFLNAFSPNSGLHAGVSVMNLSSKSSTSLRTVNAGAAYWLISNTLRLQSAWQYKEKKGAYLGGVAFRINQWFSVYAGTVSWKEAAGGVGFHSPYLNADLAVGEDGVSFSVNFRFTEDSRNIRDKHFENAKKAYDEERYGVAHEQFLTVLEYDEYYAPARSFADLSASARDTTVVVYLREGKAHEARGNYTQAIKMYSQVLKNDPDHREAHTRMNELKSRFRHRVQQLIVTGDSLRNLNKYDRARNAYKEVLEIDPDNQEVPPRLEAMEAVVQEKIEFHFARAKTFATKNQIDDAVKEYEQILLLEPQNAQAQSRLETLKARRTTSGLFERGKTVLGQGNYFEALSIFNEVLQRDPNNRDAKTFRDQARETLQRDVEDQFKKGLQYYVKEDYEAALETWNRVLLIQPNHQATLEYSKRVKDKLEALEKLK